MAGREWLEQLWTTENLDQMAGPGAPATHDGPVHDPAVLDEVRARATRYLAGRGPLFECRIAEGHAVDGHGDLLADDIFCLDDGPRILDCLAFDDDLRRGDVLADLAFLAMDLEHLEHGPAAAEALVAAYDEFADEHHPRSLLHFYVAQRALVRAKVRGLRAGQGDDPDCRRAGVEARRFLRQASSTSRRHGAPGGGGRRPRHRQDDRRPRPRRRVGGDRAAAPTRSARTWPGWHAPTTPVPGSTRGSTRRR